MKKLSLYFHFPFCLKKCHYCDFNSENYPRSLWKPYINSWLRELEQYEDLMKEREIATVYLGGGTPSLIPLPELGKTFMKIDQLGKKTENVEITLEVNPGTVTAEKAAGWKEWGINRISLGVQTFNGRLLKTLGRIYTSDKIYQAWECFEGFENTSLDLIYGIPGSSLETWLHDLKKGTDLSPSHFSLYELTLEPGTHFHRNCDRYRFPSDEELLEYSRAAEKVLEENRYLCYETSNYAREGKLSRHNMNYWERGEYLGIGAGAHSFIGERRWENIREVAGYMKAAGESRKPIEFTETINSGTSKSEFMMLGLRKRAGISLPEFQKIYGTPLFKVFPEILPRLIKEGLLELNFHDGPHVTSPLMKKAGYPAGKGGNHSVIFTVKEEFLSLTAKGRIYANEVFRELMLV